MRPSELAGLETMSLTELHALWAKLVKTNPPRMSAGLLRLALAWHIQAKAFGGLSRAAERRLRGGAPDNRPAPSLVRPGMRLLRAWNGKTHIVTVSDDGTIRWNDRDWRSLSEVARAITGTRWSGPAFFGLKSKKQAA